MSLRRIAFYISSLVLGSAAPALAQQDVIRGRVTGPDNQPIENATVTAMSMADQTSRPARTDKDGRFTLIFSPGSGDYLMTASAVGYQPAPPKEIRNDNGDPFLVYDVKLTKNPVLLNAVTTRGTRQTIDRDDANDPSRGSGVGNNERSMNMGDLALSAMGDLAQMAASIPGVTYIPGLDGAPGGFSVLGLGAEQNLTTLNGLTFDGGELPEGAIRGGSVATNSFNPAQGGFSGGAANFNTTSGTNFIVNRITSNLSPKLLQFTDEAGNQLGVQYNRGQYSLLRSGPIVYGKHFYAASFSYTRQTNNLQTLFNTDPLGLQRNGIESDSVARLQAILNANGVPMIVSGLPDDRLTESASSVLSLDLNPSGSQIYKLSFIGSFNRAKGSSLNVRSVPTHGGETKGYQLAAQGSTSRYFGAGFLDAFRSSISASGNNADPYIFLPDANVRVTSSLDDGTSAITSLSFGGNSGLPTESTTLLWQANNAISWFSMNNKHQFQFTQDLQVNKYRQDNSRNQLGTYSYLSLADFENDKPNSFSRTLNPTIRSGSTVTTAFSLSDSYRPKQGLQMQYGLRADAIRFNKSPRFNEKVETAFGIRNDQVPSGVYLSPTASFSWQYGTNSQIAAFQGAQRQARGRVSGGIRLLQSVPRAQSIDQAVDNTGLPSGVQQLSCSGSAVPVVDWSMLATNPDMIPVTCADGSGGTVFSSNSPNVSLFDKGYTPSRSLRSQLGWSGPVLGNRFNANISGTHSLNKNQQGTVDLNFDNTQRFTLADEGNRPVFVMPSSITASSGTIGSRASRKLTDFNRVNSFVSDLESVSRQLSVGISPTRTSFGFRWSANYTLQSVRELSRGFSGNTAGDPNDTQWSRSSSDSRHSFQVSLNYTFKNMLTFQLTPRVSSGTPFTPGVDRDINGDGLGNGQDRAFIYDPSKTADPALASQMQALLDDASPSVRKCLMKQMGQVAGRNTCQGPMTYSTSLTVNVLPQPFHLPQNTTIRLGFTNPLTGLDALVHGWDNLKGWGVNPQIDPTLLAVKGFDATAQRFKYEVNQRFGESRANRSNRTNSFLMTVAVTMTLGASREEQQLGMNLARGRREPGQKMNETQLVQQYRNAIRNPFNQLLQQADTLHLTDEQLDSLAMLNRNFTKFADSVWTPVGKYLAALPNEYDNKEAWDRVMAGWDQMIERLVVIGPLGKSLLTKKQLNALPPAIAVLLDPAGIRALRPGNAAGAGRAGFGR